MVFQGAKYISLHSFQDSNARSFLMPTHGLFSVFVSGRFITAAVWIKMLMSFYNLVENAEGYGYPRVGGPLKNHKTLNEKKNG